MKNLLAIISLLNCTILLVAQQEFNKTTYSIKREKTIIPSSIKSDFESEIYNLEAPFPDGTSAKSYLLRQKIASKAYFDAKKGTPAHVGQVKNGMQPIMGRAFEPKRVNPAGTILSLAVGIPSDNTLAVSNNGIVMMSMNSVVYAHNMNTDTNHFESYQINLRNFVDGMISSSYYDPKLLYDPSVDRFILTALKDFTPNTSKVIMCFSSTNDPNDPWFVYELPGNPLENNRWTDFPCLAVTSDKVYYTANLIIPDVSWQVGFDGSIIWEMDKSAAFNGDSDIEATLYHDIKFNNGFVRNLHPVNGAEGVADELILLSNRNFDIENDTLFYISLSDGDLTVKALKSNLPYGVPPNARQFDTDTSDPTNGLQTNDARVLGAIKFEDEIQFVGNSINPETGFSAIYHGVIQHTGSENPVVTATLIADPEKDFGYPNIAFSGNEKCDREVIIGFDYASPTHFPGIAAVYVDNDRNCSPALIVKEGYNYVDRLPGGYERWGDYFGLQRKYNEPGTVHSFGYLALQNRLNTGFFAELHSPDTTRLYASLSITKTDGVCENDLAIQVTNGVEPLQFFWNDEETTSESSVFLNACSGDTIRVRVADSRGCETETWLRVPFIETSPGINVYPNPVSDIAAAKFTLEEDAQVRAELFDEAGKLVSILIDRQAKKGLNEFVFNTSSLAQGMYAVAIFADGKMIQRFKVVKQ